IRAQPSRNSQIAVIKSSQKTKQGSAAHLVQAERRAPSTMAIQRGDVCTIWRITPCETAPTTSKAAIIATQHAVKIGNSLFTGRLFGVSGMGLLTLLSYRESSPYRRLSLEGRVTFRFPPPTP